MTNDSQKRRFHIRRIVGLVDECGEPVHERLESRVTKPAPADAAPHPVSCTLAQSPGQTRASSFWLGGGRRLLEPGVLARQFRFGNFKALGGTLG